MLSSLLQLKKALLPTEAKSAGVVTLLSAVQFSKRLLGIFLSMDIFIVLNAVHPLKTPSPKLALSDNVKPVILLQLANACSPMKLNGEGEQFTVMLPQFKKARAPTFFKLSGKALNTNFSQLQKASSPIEVSPEGRLTFDKFEQSLKARSPMAVTVSGMPVYSLIEGSKTFIKFVFSLLYKATPSK